MSRELDAAVAAEIRAEVARQGLARTEVGRRAGVDARAWSRYFVKVERDLPLKVLAAVCGVLGVSVSEVLARAETNLPATDELMEGLSTSDLREVNNARREHGVEA